MILFRNNPRWSRAWLHALAVAFALGGCGLKPLRAGRVSAEGDLRTIDTVHKWWVEADRPEAQKRLVPIRLSGRILFADPEWKLLWMERDGQATYIKCNQVPVRGRPGDYVTLNGMARPDQGLEVGKVSVEVTPGPPTPELEDITSKLKTYHDFDLCRVRVHGYVGSQEESGSTHVSLEVICADVRVTCRVVTGERTSPPDYQGKDVTVDGLMVVSQGTDTSVGGAVIWVADPEQVRIDNVRAEGWAKARKTPLGDLSNTAPGTQVVSSGIAYSHDEYGRLILLDSTSQASFYTAQSRRFHAGDPVLVRGRVKVTKTGVGLEEVLALPGPSVMAKEGGAGGPLRLVHQVLWLPESVVKKGVDVNLAGVVTAVIPRENRFYVQDSTGGICVKLDHALDPAIQPNSGIHVEGKVRVSGMISEIEATGFKVRGGMNRPIPKRGTYEEALSGNLEGQFVEMSGYLSAVETKDSTTMFRLSTGFGDFSVRLLEGTNETYRIGALIRVQGVCVALAAGNGSMGSFKILAPSGRFVEVEQQAPADRFSTPLISIAEAKRRQSFSVTEGRVRVRGKVTYYLPGHFLVLDDRRFPVRVLCADENLAVELGDLIEAEGIPGRKGVQFLIRDGHVRKVSSGTELLSEGFVRDFSSEAVLDGRLVTIRAVVENVAFGNRSATILLREGQVLHRAVLEGMDHLERDLKVIEEGATVDVVGLYNPVFDEQSRIVGFNLQARSIRDFSIVKRPEWLTRRLLLIASCIGLVGTALVVIWVWSLRRRVERQTARIRAEAEEKMKLEVANREIVANVRDLIFTLDMDGRFTSFNKAGFELTGFTPEEALKMTVYDLVDERSARRVRLVFERLSARFNFKVFEAEIVRKDGTKIWVETSAGFLRAGDSPIGGLGVMRDISGRKKLQADLTAARDSAEANVRLKSAFLATMSHELRTPLNGVIGMCGLLLDTDLNDEQKEYAQAVRGSSEALLGLINDILDFSKIEAGKLRLESEPFSILEKAERVLFLVAPLAAAKRLELGVFLSPLVPKRLVGDSGRLRQVLLNLIGNSIKFTEKGQVLVTINPVSLTETEATLRIEVVDTGIGIAPASIKKIFEPFVQADGNDSRRYGGAGLGLAICRQIVTLMGGEIGCESVPGEGSTFWFTFKCLREPVFEPGRPTPPEGFEIVAHTLTPIVQHLVEHHGDTLGIPTRTFTEETELLSYLGKTPVPGARRLVILEAPEIPMTALELSTELAKLPTAPHHAVALLSSLENRPSRETLANAAVNFALAKPLTCKEIEQSIARIQARKATPPSSSPTKPVKSGPAFRILIAEDNLINQRVTKLQIVKMGFDCDIVSDGKAAIETLTAGDFDAVLMDCQMPVMDGLEATRKLRAMPRFANLPIIALTANALAEDRERCLESGMNDFLTKPLRPQELNDALNRALRVASANVEASASPS